MQLGGEVLGVLPGQCCHFFQKRSLFGAQLFSVLSVTYGCGCLTIFFCFNQPQFSQSPPHIILFAFGVRSQAVSLKRIDLCLLGGCQPLRELIPLPLLLLPSLRTPTTLCLSAGRTPMSRR